MDAVIIGNTASIYIKDFIRNVCIHLFSNIVILSQEMKDWDYFQRIGIKVYYTGWYEREKKMPEGLRIVKKRRNDICDQLNNIDALMVHYCSGGDQMYCYKKLLGKSKKTYMVYWGSDILNSDHRNIELNREAIQGTEKVICMSKSVKNALENYYDDLVTKKTRIMDFGVVYSDIRDMMLKTSRRECKRKFSFPEEKLSVMIGYNGSKRQQHIPVLDAVIRLHPDIKNILFLFFPMSYGRDEEYRNEVESRAAELGIKYMFVDSFLDRERLVYMRLATDVFIHAQTTDALSGSLCECLYAGAKVLNPSWIKYSELMDNGIPLYEYKDFDQLPIVLENVIDSIYKDDQEIGIYRERLWRMNERNSMMEQWIKMLEE